MKRAIHVADRALVSSQLRTIYRIFMEFFEICSTTPEVKASVRSFTSRASRLFSLFPGLSRWRRMRSPRSSSLLSSSTKRRSGPSSANSSTGPSRPIVVRATIPPYLLLLTDSSSSVMYRSCSREEACLLQRLYGSRGILQGKFHRITCRFRC